MKAQQITAIVETATSSINTRREEVNNTLSQIEQDFESFKSLVISSLVPDAMDRINERRDEANAKRHALEVSFSEYSQMVQEWSQRQIVALVS